MITFLDSYLQSASVNSVYTQALNVTGGTAPYSFAITSGSLPSGITMTASGLLSGTPAALGSYTFAVSVADSSVPQQTSFKAYTLTVLDLITLSDTTVDQGQFVAQFQNRLATTQTWSAGLTTQTSQTLIEYISAVGTFITAKIVRAVEDSFPETAQSDSAIRSIANMQGLRIARMLPATMQVTATSASLQVIPPFTQWSAGGYSWFNAQPITLQPNVAQTVTLKEGRVVQNQLSGLGTDLQAYITAEDAFSVSDQDVVVSINSQNLNKVFGPLWNYPGVKAYTDLTLNDGRAVLQFGSQGYGAVPGVNDIVDVVYAVTQGATVNGANLAGVRVSCNPLPTINATAVSNPSGGADTKPVVAYKNFAAGSFGTYSSGVTKAQYQALVNNYPGIIDASTQAQREINPSALKWMNVIRVSALTTSPWNQQQVQDFLNYMQNITMYTTKFIWQDPVKVERDVEIEIYCFNSVNSLSDVENNVASAITNLFSPRPGILMTDFFLSDLEQSAMNAAPGQISYVIVKKPTDSMLVTPPTSPQITYTVVPSGGSLTPLLYSYSVSVDVPSPNPNYMGLWDPLVESTFPPATAAGQYWIASNNGTIYSTTFALGDQILLISLDDGMGDQVWDIKPMATNGVIDFGAPSNWVNPEVTVTNSKVILNWSANPVPGALSYSIWGRRAGYIGIITSVPHTTLNYTDLGGPDPTPLPTNAQSDTLIRYNSLRSLKVTAFYAKRQTNVLLPIRDSLS